MSLGLPLVGDNDWYEKAQESVSVTVLRIEASRIALIKSDGNTQKPYAVYATIAFGHAFSKTTAESMILHIHGHLPLLNP